MPRLMYSDNEEVYRYDDIEEALESVWGDQLDDSEPFTVWEGELNSDEWSIINVRERKFKLVNDDGYFDMVNFEEITTEVSDE